MRNHPLHPSSFIPHPSRRRRAFTFAEIMFAVVILGIGFIMVAAMFPVAIRSTQATLEDTSAIAEARRGEAIVRQLGVAMAGYYNSYQVASAKPITDETGSAFANVVVQPQRAYGAANQIVGAPLQTFFARATAYPQYTPPAGVNGPASAAAVAPIASLVGDLINQFDTRIAWIPVAYQCDMQSVDANNDASCVDANGQPTFDNNPTDPTTGLPTAPKPATDANGITRVPVARALPQLARVWLVAVQKRDPDSPQYTNSELYPAGYNPKTAPVIDNSSTLSRYSYLDTLHGTFVPKRVYFKLVEGQDPNIFGASYPDTVVFTDSSGQPVDEPAADTGAYVWVADDQVTVAIPAGPPGPTGQYAYGPGAANGRFYRLASKVDGVVGVWELQTGGDMQIVKNPGRDGIYDNADDGTPTLENLPPRPYDVANHPYATKNYSSITGNPAVGFMIGKSLRNPAAAYNPTSNPYVGTAQDLFALPPVTVFIKQ